LLFVFWYLVLF